MDGGLTFLPQPCVADCSASLTTSTKDGGANTTAVLEIVAVVEGAAAVVEFDAVLIGIRGAGTFVLLPSGRRTGAKARLADHPTRDKTYGGF